MIYILASMFLVIRHPHLIVNHYLPHWKVIQVNTYKQTTTCLHLTRQVFLLGYIHCFLSMFTHQITQEIKVSRFVRVRITRWRLMHFPKEPGRKKRGKLADQPSSYHQWTTDPYSFQQAKKIMQRNGIIMKEVMKDIVSKIMVENFGLVENEDGKQATTPLLKEILIELLKVREPASK